MYLHYSAWPSFTNGEQASFGTHFYTTGYQRWNLHYSFLTMSRRVTNSIPQAHTGNCVSLIETRHGWTGQETKASEAPDSSHSKDVCFLLCRYTRHEQFNSKCCPCWCAASCVGWWNVPKENEKKPLFLGFPFNFFFTFLVQRERERERERERARV